MFGGAVGDLREEEEDRWSVLRDRCEATVAAVEALSISGNPIIGGRSFHELACAWQRCLEVSTAEQRSFRFDVFLGRCWLVHQDFDLQEWDS
jgi:hypothetical protein